MNTYRCYLLLLGFGASITAGAMAGEPDPGPVREESPDSIRVFTARIQPILFNSCGSGACHGGSAAKSFTLKRPVSTGQLTPAMTRHNLNQALTLIDKEDSPNSQLLKMALEAHGGAARPPMLSKQTPAYQHLEAWVLKNATPKRVFDLGTPERTLEPEDGEHKPTRESFASEVRPPKPDVGPPTRPRLLDPAEATLRGGQVVGASNQGPAPPFVRVGTPSTQDETVVESKTPRLPSGIPPRPATLLRGGNLVGSSDADVKQLRDLEKTRKAGESKNRPGPVDPFDPIIFNRQHHPDRDP
jgi:hypothetical protein